VHRAGLEALSALAVRDPLERALQEAGLERLYREIELPLIPILARMEADGIGVDLAALAVLASASHLKSSSRVSSSASFFGIESNSPDVRIRSYSCILETRLAMVSKLVSIPPSQRSLTYGMPHFSAKLRTGSWACFLVPMNSTVPPSADRSRTKLYAASTRDSVCSRSMM